MSVCINNLSLSVSKSATVNKCKQFWSIGDLSQLVASAFFYLKGSAHHQFVNGTYFATSALVLKFSAFCKPILSCIVDKSFKPVFLKFFPKKSTEELIKDCKVWRPHNTVDTSRLCNKDSSIHHFVNFLQRFQFKRRISISLVSNSKPKYFFSKIWWDKSEMS